MRDHSFWTNSSKKPPPTGITSAFSSPCLSYALESYLSRSDVRGGHHKRGGGNDPHPIYRIPGMWLISRCWFLTRPRVKASRPTTGLTQVHRTHPLLSDLAGGCVLAQVASENSRPQPQPQRTTTTPVQQVQQEASGLQPARP